MLNHSKPKSKLFHHYKNKPYKFIGYAKHSETLEDMVIYETLYENNQGRIWVRPQKMFFEKVQLQNKLTPRFQEIPIVIESTTEVTAAQTETIRELSQKIFGEWDMEWFHSTLNNHKILHLAMASINGQYVGYKLGYGRNQKMFYSWLGAVSPEYRSLGIATELMRVQHGWCRENGYTKVQTETQNRFSSMLQLNIKTGFEIIGTHLSSKGGLQIVMEKKL
jgi:hypothetical protein